MSVDVKKTIKKNIWASMYCQEFRSRREESVDGGGLCVGFFTERCWSGEPGHRAQGKGVTGDFPLIISPEAIFLLQNSSHEF